MQPMIMQEFHRGLGAQFTAVNGVEAVDHYGDPNAEYRALTALAGVVDLSFRSRLCLTGKDRLGFLNGQVTNDVQSLNPGQGCYAALVNAKGRIQADLNIRILQDEILLDLEPGYAAAVAGRLEQFIIAEDVQVVEVGPDYGMLGVLGPRAGGVMARLGGPPLPAAPHAVVGHAHPQFGEVYLARTPRCGLEGYDLFVPAESLTSIADLLREFVGIIGGRWVGWRALETARIEAGVPRFGVDMDETNLAPETGLERHAISYTKGCYIGQEVIARIRTYGQVTRALRGLLLPDALPRWPQKGDALLQVAREVGYVTSAVASPRLGRNIALGYVRREHNAPGTDLLLRLGDQEVAVQVSDLPFAVH